MRNFSLLLARQTTDSQKNFFDTHHIEDGLPIPPYKIYNIGNNSPENLLDFVQILQEEPLAAGVLSAGYDFEAHKELVPMQSEDVQSPMQIHLRWRLTLASNHTHHCVKVFADSLYGISSFILINNSKQYKL